MVFLSPLPISNSMGLGRLEAYFGSSFSSGTAFLLFLSGAGAGCYGQGYCVMVLPSPFWRPCPRRPGLDFKAHTVGEKTNPYQLSFYPHTHIMGPDPVIPILITSEYSTSRCLTSKVYPLSYPVRVKFQPCFTEKIIVFPFSIESNKRYILFIIYSYKWMTRNRFFFKFMRLDTSKVIQLLEIYRW